MKRMLKIHFFHIENPNCSKRFFFKNQPFILVQEHDSNIQGRGYADPDKVGNEQHGGRF